MKARKKYPSHPTPSTPAASAPASAPPPVFASVFSERMAAIGRSTSWRSRFSVRPAGLPARSSASTRLAGTAYSTASNSEQAADVSSTSPTITVRATIDDTYLWNV